LIKFAGYNAGDIEKVSSEIKGEVALSLCYSQSESSSSSKGAGGNFLLGNRR